MSAGLVPSTWAKTYMLNMPEAVEVGVALETFLSVWTEKDTCAIVQLRDTIADSVFSVNQD